MWHIFLVGRNNNKNQKTKMKTSKNITSAEIRDFVRTKLAAELGGGVLGEMLAIETVYRVEGEAPVAAGWLDENFAAGITKTPFMSDEQLLEWFLGIDWSME